MDANNPVRLLSSLEQGEYKVLKEKLLAVQNKLNTRGFKGSKRDDAVAEAATIKGKIKDLEAKNAEALKKWNLKQAEKKAASSKSVPETSAGKSSTLSRKAIPKGKVAGIISGLEKDKNPKKGEGKPAPGDETGSDVEEADFLKGFLSDRQQAAAEDFIKLKKMADKQAKKRQKEEERAKRVKDINLKKKGIVEEPKYKKEEDEVLAGKIEPVKEEETLEGNKIGELVALPEPGVPDKVCDYLLYERKPTKDSPHLTDYISYRAAIERIFEILRAPFSQENLKEINARMSIIDDIGTYYLYLGHSVNMFLHLNGTNDNVLYIKSGSVIAAKNKKGEDIYYYYSHHNLKLEESGQTIEKPKHGQECLDFYHNYILKYYPPLSNDYEFEDDILLPDDLEFLTRQLQGTTIIDACVDVQFLDEETRRSVLAMCMSCALNGRVVAQDLHDTNNLMLEAALANTVYRTPTGYNATTLMRVGHLGIYADASSKISQEFASKYGAPNVWEMLKQTSPPSSVTQKNWEIKKDFAKKHPLVPKDLEAVVKCFALRGGYELARTNFAADERRPGL